MNIIVLAAGYGTRLGPIVGPIVGCPKGLLRLGDRCVLDHLLASVDTLTRPFTLWVVTNTRFIDAYRGWADEAAARLTTVPIVLDDGTRAPEERLGAIGDLAFALERIDRDRDTLVMVTDTLFEFSLGRFLEELDARPSADLLLAVLEEADREALGSRGVVILNSAGWVDRFQEKPQEPCSQLTALPLYLIRRSLLPQVHEYLASGGDPDAPGHLIEWLVDRVRVAGWRAPGARLDVGTPAGYREACSLFSNRASARPKIPKAAQKPDS